VKYSDNIIMLKYLDNLSNAKLVLQDLDFAGAGNISFKGLNRWVFEQTLRQCLKEELIDKSKIYDIQEQVILKGRATADLVVGRVAIEIKSRGLFMDESEKYAKLRTAANDKGWDYLYIALDESHAPLKISTRNAFDDDKSFFLDEASSWSRFVDKIVELNTENKANISNQQ
jgi:hypothetical protein